MSFLSGFLGTPPKEEQDTQGLLLRVTMLRPKSMLCDLDAELELIVSVMEDAGKEFDGTLGTCIGGPVFELVNHLLGHEALTVPIIEDTSEYSLSDGAAYRNDLRRGIRMLANEQHYIGKWKDALVAILGAMYREFPPQAFVDPDEDGNFEEYSRLAPVAPLYTYVKNVPVLLHQIIATIFAKDLENDELFFDLREQLLINLAEASNIPFEDRYTTSKQAVLPEDKRGLDDAGLINLYLAGTPFIDIFATDVPLYIPEAIRFEHTHVLAGTGHGKTQTLQFLIAGDLEEALKERRSVVVMDSQGDLLQTLMHSRYFEEGGLRDRLIYIDPQDIECPVGLNLFDVDFGDATRSNAVARETILNGTIELYEYFFGGLLGAELTQKQGMVFRYLATLMTRIPGANIHTLLELMENGEKFKPFMQTLPGSARLFFETRFFDRTFSETKKQILTRLWGVLANQTLDRMMSAKKNSVDLFQSLQNGSIVFINTAGDFLGREGSSIFSRMFVALLGQALMRRAAVAKHERTPTYIYIDEAEEVVDLTLTRLLAQVRKYKGAITFAHQNLDQLESSIRAGVMANTSIKLAGGVSAKDAHTLAGDFRCDADFLLSQKKGKRDTHFACFARNVTDQAVTLSIPLGYLESQEKLSAAEYQELLETSRQKYGVPYSEDFHSHEFPDEAAIPNTEDKRRSGATAPSTSEPLTSPSPSETSEKLSDIAITRAPASPEPMQVRDVGGGGIKHKYLEHLIKELGEERGFRASVEESVHDGAGRVDVILRREEISLAFEISVTTTKDHELGNIEKCLALPFTHVVMLASYQRHLKGLSSFIERSLEETEKRRVSFLLPEDLPGFLDGYPISQERKEKTVKGYTVRTRVRDAQPSDALARRKAIAAVVARSIQS